MNGFRGSRTSSRAAAGDDLPTFEISVTKVGSGEGTVVSQPAGIVCGSTGVVDFPSLLVDQ